MARARTPGPGSGRGTAPRCQGLRVRLAIPSTAPRRETNTVNAPRRLAVLAGGMVPVGLFLRLPRAGRSEEPAETRQKEIAAVEKQIANLNKKLTELKNGSATAAVKAPAAGGL